MKTKYITKNLVDVFLPPEKQHRTGWDSTLWLRVQKRGNAWVQIAGIKLPSWKFKQIMEALNTCV